MPARSVTVGTTATVVLPFNRARTAVSIFNNDTAAVFVSDDQRGILGEGFVIVAGQPLNLLRAWGDNPQDVLYGISVAGGADVRVLEQFGLLPVLFDPETGKQVFPKLE